MEFVFFVCFCLHFVSSLSIFLCFVCFVCLSVGLLFFTFFPSFFSSLLFSLHGPRYRHILRSLLTSFLSQSHPPIHYSFLRSISFVFHIFILSICLSFLLPSFVCLFVWLFVCLFVSFFLPCFISFFRSSFLLSSLTCNHARVRVYACTFYNIMMLWTALFECHSPIHVNNTAKNHRTAQHPFSGIVQHHRINHRNGSVSLHGQR